MADYLTYDEMQIGALLIASSPTFFINDGARHNCGKRDLTGTPPARAASCSSFASAQSLIPFSSILFHAALAVLACLFAASSLSCAPEYTDWTEHYPLEGVLMGAVGARFERAGRMEYCHMIVDCEQNTKVPKSEAIAVKICTSLTLSPVSLFLVVHCPIAH